MSDAPASPIEQAKAQAEAEYERACHALHRACRALAELEAAQTIDDLQAALEQRVDRPHLR